ncbi:MAG: glutathione S-transferase family protein [Nevskiales bacterium]
MSKPYVLYAWHLSYFSGKTRCYLRYKGIPYVEKPIDIYTFSVRIKKKTGAAVMPVVVTPEGEWLQDTSVIIDRLEQRFPEAPVVPATPVQRFAAYLMELWGDEWWIPIAMHTRWSYPENYPLFEREGGDHLLPGFPRFLKNRVIAKAANQMRSHKPNVGIVPEQFEMMERWTHDMLDTLDRHFAQLPYLFGDKPSLGDFGLIGTMYGHLGRDPWPKQHMVDPRKNLRAWIDRMAEPPQPRGGHFLPGDHIPETLEPVYRAICREFIPMLEGNIRELRAYLPNHPDDGRPVPRGLGFVEFPMGQGRFRRAALPYTLWMAQRMLDVYRAMPAAEQVAVRTWLQTLGGERLLELDIPRLKRRALRVEPDQSAA